MAQGGFPQHEVDRGGRINTIYAGGSLFDGTALFLHLAEEFRRKMGFLKGYRNKGEK
jgi:hypothetical protein